MNETLLWIFAIIGMITVGGILILITNALFGSTTTTHIERRPPLSNPYGGDNRWIEYDMF